MPFDGGGQGTLSSSPYRRGRQWRVQHSSVMSRISKRKRICRGSRLEEWCAQDNDGLGVRQTDGEQ